MTQDETQQAAGRAPRRGRHAAEPELPLAPEAPLQPEPPLPPDAAARDAAKREEMGEADDTLRGDDISFVTRGVSAEERAAAIAVLTRMRTEETNQVKRVARRDREPWARSQRVPDRISDLLAEG